MEMLVLILQTALIMSERQIIISETVDIVKAQMAL